MVNRVGGLVSGMDIDELVKKLMSAEKAPLNKLYQKKQTYEWQRDAYRSVNTKLKTFDTYIADNLILKTINSKTATSSNSSLVSVTASGKATGTLSIDGVSQLAKAARGVSDTQVNAIGSTKVSDLFKDGATEMPKSISLRSIDVTGKLASTPTKIVLDENMTVDQFVSKINASNAGVSAIFEGGKLSITAKNTGDNKEGAEVQVTDGAEVFKKLGFTKLNDTGDLASDGQNAIFSVNGIATERSTNTFSINGYNVTLKDTFNGIQTIADKYKAAVIELENAKINKETKKDYLQTAKDSYYGLGATSTPNFTTEHNNKYIEAFGSTLTLSQQETYAKLGRNEWKDLSDDEIDILGNLSASTSVVDIKTAIKDSNLSDESKAKLSKLSDEKLQVLVSLNETELAEFELQGNYETYSSKLKNLSNDTISVLRNLELDENESLEDIYGKIEKIENITDDQIKALKTLTKEELVHLNTIGSETFNKYQEKAQADNLKIKYNTLGESFLTGATEESKLTDKQKEVLNSLSDDELSNFKNLAAENKKRLEYKNAEAEYNAAVTRENNAVATEATAKEDAKNAGILKQNAPGVDEIDQDKVDAATNAPPVTMTSTTNVDEMMTKIKEFVNTYNGFIKDLTAQTKETKYRDYPPLTDEQKEELSENEIKLWEEKAKSGLLRNDALIREGLTNMRSLIYQSNPAIDSKYNTLFSIGITTSKNYNDGGTLEIDEAKLRKVLEEDPDAVEKLFKNSDGKEKDLIEVQENGKTVTKEVDTRGFLYTLRSSMKVMEINIEKKAGRSTMTDAQYVIGKNLIDAEKRIATWKTKLENIEARYWKQFTAMETAINKANSQSSIFSTE